MKEKLISLKVRIFGTVRILFRNLIKNLLSDPEYIIIGAQKCGTTSLFRYLRKHPCVAAAYNKEIHFFDKNYQKGLNWYKANFPTKLNLNVFKFKCSSRKRISGDATPYYLFHPYASNRIKESFPNVKLIVLLRDPIRRAYSHYYHEKHKNRENLSFKEAVEKERSRISPEIRKMKLDHSYISFNHQHFSYISSSIYVDQLKKWFKLFPRDQFLIIKTEDFLERTEDEYNRILEFLQLPAYQLKDYRKYLKQTYKPIDKNIEKELREFFDPYNQELYELTGIDFGW